MSTSDTDSYLTIESPLRAPEFKVKGSRFIGDLVPVSDKTSIEQALSAIRKEFYDATHHCFAYRLGPTGAVVRAADDGEPSGTAGRPILLVLTSSKLTDALLVVTRFYGGTKLGTGGLARAYAEAAQQALSMAKVRKVYLTESLTLQINYDDLAPVERLIAQHQGESFDAIYLDSVNMKVRLRRSLVDQFKTQLIDNLHGRVGVI